MNLSQSVEWIIIAWKGMKAWLKWQKHVIVNFRYLPDYHDKCGKKKILHQKLNQSLREYLNGRIQILLNDLKAIFVLNVRIKAYYNLSVKILTVYRRRPPINLRPEGLFLERGRRRLWLTGSLPCISVHYIFAILLTFWVWEWIPTPWD